MHGIDQVKGVNAGSIDVVGDGWRLRGRIRILEIKALLSSEKSWQRLNP